MSLTFPTLRVSPPQGESGFYNISEHRDLTATALLNGAKARDGGGRGDPVQTIGNGACLMNAVAAGAFGANCSSTRQSLSHALPLRVAVVKTALPNFLNPDAQPNDYATLQMYDADVIDEAATLGASLRFDAVDQSLPIGVARLLYLLAVKSVIGEYKDCQQACLPWLAETLGLRIRCFHPGGFSQDECMAVDLLLSPCSCTHGNVSLRLLTSYR